MSIKVSSLGTTVLVKKVGTESSTFVKTVRVGVPRAAYIATTTETFSGMQDVNVAGAQNGDILIYDSASQKWINSTFTIKLDAANLGGTGLTYDSATDTLHIDSAEFNTYFLNRISTNLIPIADSTYDLGDSNYKWKDLYLSGSTIYLGNIKLKEEGSTFVVRDSGNNVVAVNLDGNTTDDLSEGSNLYYTDARVQNVVTKTYVDGLNVNADTLDGVSSGAFLRGDASDTKTSGDLSFLDNVKLKFGNSNDLQIYHNGVSNIVEDVGTGGLTLRGNNVYLQDDAAGGYNLFAQGLHNAAFEIYYDGSKKFETTSTGVTVTGQVTGDSATFANITRSGATSYSGSWGSATEIPVVTVDASGFIDSIGTTTVAGVTSTTYDSATGVFTINTADGGSFATTLHDSDDRIAEIRGALSASGDLTYNSSTGQFSFDVESVYTKANFDSDLSLALSTDAVTTTDLTEGDNLYYTTVRADSAFDVRLATKTTTDLTEGDNLYYTTDRADSDAKNAFSGGTGVDITAGVVSIGQAVETTSDVTFAKIEGDSVSISQIDFNTLYAEHIPYKEGSVWYDQIHKTLNYWSDDSNVVHEIGIEEHQRVYNNTGSTITKGQPLYFSGNYNPGGGAVAVPTVGLADATDVNAYNAQGLAAGDIQNNSYGYCIISGQLDKVNTQGLSAGANFFVGLTPGAVQNASPVYPNYPMCLGWVVKTGDSNGVLLVNQQNHSVNSFRVRTSAHIGSDLIVGGNLTVTGTQTIISTENVQIGGNIQFLNAGNTIGEANTTFAGSGLDDAFFAGHYSGDSSTKSFYVKIDSAGATDTFEWGHDSTVGPVATGIAITGSEQTLTAGIKIDFGATTGHTLGDVWAGTAAATETDTGIFSNRNTGDGGDGYTHVGFFFDVSENKWRLLDAYDSEPEAPINITAPSLSYGTLVLDTVEGNLTGNVTGNADTATQLANNRAFSITGDITATGVNFNGTGNVALNAAITSGSIVNDDINDSAAIADTKLATISTAGKVLNSATSATDANTASAIVARDASGNFSAGVITATFSGNLTGNVTGNASTADSAADAGQLNGQTAAYYLNYNNFTNTPTNVSTFVNDANYLDSTTVQDVINASYIQSNQTTYNTSDFLDSTTVSLVVDAAYVQARQTTYSTADFLDSYYATALIDSAYIASRVSAGTDSSTVVALITSTVDNSYVQSRQITYNTSDFPDSAGVTTLANSAISSATGSSILAYDANLQGFVTAFTLPTSDGTTGQVLQTNGSGTLSFVDQSGGGLSNAADSGSGVTVSGDLTVQGNIFADSDVTASNFNTTSDARIKTNVRTIYDALDKTMQLRGVYFDKNGKPDIGLIAQEVEEVMPMVVNTLNDEMQTKTVNYGGLVGLLVQAIKSQQEQIDDLTDKVNKLLDK